MTPEYVNLGLARSYQLAPDLWDDVEFTTEWNDEPDDHALNSPTFVKGAARFTGSLSLRFEGLAVGEVVQVRMSEHDDAGQQQHTHPPHEVIGTSGGTYSCVPLTKRLGAGRTMRVQLLNQGADSIEVASAVLTALVWGE
ncbi:hypothetical protein [Streptomyces sp. NPDC048392]|uniref:hypothetical protein n=1 Tax=Streptomyces sp. NPDC048392 TaxID=3365543 RepID=UPI0037121974